MLGQLAVILLVVVAVKSDGECNPDTFRNCLEGVVHEAFQPQPGFPDEEFFNKFCRPGIETAVCVRDAARRCPHVGTVAEHLPMFEAIVDFLHSICDEGSELKEGYLANVNCYNRSLPQMKECVDRMQNVVEKFFESFQNETEQEMGQVKKYCLLELMLVKCIVKVSTAACGADGAAPLVNIMDQLYAMSKQVSCPDDTLVVLEATFLTYIEEIGFELKKKRRK